MPKYFLKRIIFFLQSQIENYFFCDQTIKFNYAAKIKYFAIKCFDFSKKLSTKKNKTFTSRVGTVFLSFLHFSLQNVVKGL